MHQRILYKGRPRAGRASVHPEPPLSERETRSHRSVTTSSTKAKTKTPQISPRQNENQQKPEVAGRSASQMATGSGGERSKTERAFQANARDDPPARPEDMLRMYEPVAAAQPPPENIPLHIFIHTYIYIYIYIYIYVYHYLSGYSLASKYIK